jgi:hypothetical protein
LRLVPAEEGEEPGEGRAEDRSFDGAGELVPREVTVQNDFEDHVEDGVDDEPREEESPGWFFFHDGPSEGWTVGRENCQLVVKNRTADCT